MFTITEKIYKQMAEAINAMIRDGRYTSEDGGRCYGEVEGEIEGEGYAVVYEFKVACDHDVFVRTEFMGACEYGDKFGTPDIKRGMVKVYDEDGEEMESDFALAKLESYV